MKFRTGDRIFKKNDCLVQSTVLRADNNKYTIRAEPDLYTYDDVPSGYINNNFIRLNNADPDKKLILLGVIIGRGKTGKAKHGKSRYLFQNRKSHIAYEEYIKNSYQTLKARDKKRGKKDAPSWGKYKQSMKQCIMEVNKDLGFKLITCPWANTHIMIVNLTCLTDIAHLDIDGLIHQEIRKNHSEEKYGVIQHFVEEV